MRLIGETVIINHVGEFVQILFCDFTKAILEADYFGKLFRTYTHPGYKLAFKGSFGNKERIADFFNGYTSITF